MSETTDDPVEQDGEARASRVRLFRLLGLARFLAGPRGHSRVVWWGQGFRYTLTTERVPPEDFLADADPAVEYAPAYARLVHALLLLTRRED